MIAKVHGRWAFVSHTHKPLAYWHGSGRPTKKWEAEQEQRVEMFKHMDAVKNPRSKYKPGDAVVFTYAGPNFQRTAKVEYVRKDGALVVIHDDGSGTQVVQPYEIGPLSIGPLSIGSAEVPVLRENPVEPWDDEQRRAQLGPRPSPRLISFDPRCFVQAGTEVFWTVSRSALHSGPARFNNEADAVAFANKTNSPMTRHEQPRMVRISWTCPAENPRATHTSGDFHTRIAAALGWPLRDVQSVSLQSLRDLVRPVDPQLADDISRKVQSGSHLVHTGVEVSPTERQIIDFMLVDAEDVDRGNFSRTTTEEVATHFKIDPKVAYKRLNALAKRGILDKTRDIMKKHRGAHAVGWQFWEYAWKPGDEAYADTIRTPRSVSNPVMDPNDPVPVVVPVAKPGPHGELLRYTVFFRDPGKPAFEGEETWSTWAYSIENAGDLFREVHDGFQVVRTELEVLAPVATAENPRRAPSKRFGDIVWTWEREGLYRAVVGGQPTEWLGSRNDNEPASSPLRWSLLRGDEVEPYTELGSLEAISGALGRMLARGVFTR